ncbi:hypothetical protein ABZW30_13310 [Kitasatospora sp. NPDC004669]
MFERLRSAVCDTVVEFQGHRARYVRLVMDADGNADRVAWLHR